MLKPTAKILCKSFLSLFLVLLVIISSFFMWVITGPRSINFAHSYIEEELKKRIPAYTLTMGDSFIAWDREQYDIILLITNLYLSETSQNQLSQKEKRIIAHAPELRLDLSFTSSLTGRATIPNIRLVRPEFHMKLKWPGIAQKSNNNTEEIRSQLFNEFTRMSGVLKHIDKLTIHHGNVILDNGTYDTTWSIKQGTFSVHKEKIHTKLEFSHPNHNTIIEADLDTNEGVFNADIGFKNLPSFMAYDIVPKLTTSLPELSADGSIKALLTKEGTIPQISFTFDRINGSIALNKLINQELTLSDISASGHIYDMRSLVLDSGHALVNNAPLSVQGQAIQEDEGLSINLEASLDDVPIDALPVFWHENLIPPLRNYLIGALRGGKVARATAKLDLTPEVFKRFKMRKEAKMRGEESTTPALGKEQMQLSFAVEDTEFTYHPNYPKLSEIDAMVYVSGTDFSLDVKDGKTGNTTLTKGHASITNIWQQPLMLHIEGEVNGYAQDGLAFLRNHIKPKPQTPLASIMAANGALSASYQMDIPIKKNIGYRDTPLKIHAKLRQARLPQFLAGKDVEQGDFNLHLDHQMLYVQGNARLADTDITVDFTKSLTEPAQNYEYQLVAKGDASALKTLNIIDLPELTGPLGLDMHVKESNHARHMQGNINLDKAHFSLPQFGFHKKPDKQAELSFTVTQNTAKQHLDVKELHLKGQDKLLISGTSSIDLKQKKIEQAQLNRIRFDQYDFALDYALKQNTHHITAQGNSMGMSLWQMQEATKETTERKHVELKIESKEFHLKNNILLNEFKGNLHCSPFCQEGEFYGNFNKEHYLSINLKPLGKQATLMVEANHAETVMKGLNITQNLRGGHLYIQALSHFEHTLPVMEGHLTIEDFHMVETPLLGQLLNLASLTGIADLFNQKGLSFDLFEAPFTMQKGIITVHDARSKGSSIGITSEGEIDVNKQYLNLTGVLVPSSAVNTLVEKIPLIGTLITGGKGKGLIASNYRIEGPFDDTNITVNPISLLAPGFLRELFQAPKKKRQK